MIGRERRDRRGAVPCEPSARGVRCVRQAGRLELSAGPRGQRDGSLGISPGLDERARRRKPDVGADGEVSLRCVGDRESALQIDESVGRSPQREQGLAASEQGDQDRTLAEEVLLRRQRSRRVGDGSGGVATSRLAEGLHAECLVRLQLALGARELGERSLCEREGVVVSVPLDERPREVRLLLGEVLGVLSPRGCACERGDPLLLASGLDEGLGQVRQVLQREVPPLLALHRNALQRRDTRGAVAQLGLALADVAERDERLLARLTEERDGLGVRATPCGGFVFFVQGEVDTGEIAVFEAASGALVAVVMVGDQELSCTGSVTIPVTCPLNVTTCASPSDAGE